MQFWFARDGVVHTRERFGVRRCSGAFARSGLGERAKAVEHRRTGKTLSRAGMLTSLAAIDRSADD